MDMKGVLVGFVLINLSVLPSCEVPRRAVDVPFWNNYELSWSSHHIKYLNGGTGFQLKRSYLFGHFIMKLKLFGRDSAGVITAFYVTESEWITMAELEFHVEYSKDIGVKFPFNQPMKIYSSPWNAYDWAVTRGGLEKNNWPEHPSPLPILRSTLMDARLSPL
ncbi:putative xyloglucan endotransglucosylase/hydrolase protein [Capsicum chinense]|nr:putative xyloglucan endotransglucosylase/hydrolase protein [Capsicum chinense]